MSSSTTIELISSTGVSFPPTTIAEVKRTQAALIKVQSVLLGFLTDARQALLKHRENILELERTRGQLNRAVWESLLSSEIEKHTTAIREVNISLDRVEACSNLEKTACEVEGKGSIQILHYNILMLIGRLLGELMNLHAERPPVADLP